MTDGAQPVSYLTARQAADELGVSVSTLYAYVSRGQLASEPIPGSRSRRYARREVERLKRRRRVRRDPSRAGEGSLAWGEPVVDSAVTLIDGERLFYRGLDAVRLAAEASFEEVAALLWTGDRKAAGDLFAAPWPRLDRAAAKVAATLRRAAPLERCQAVLPLAGAADPAAWDLRPAAVAASGVRILRLVALLAAGVDEPPAGDGERPPGVAATLAAGWGIEAPAAVRAVEQALVLCADHELDVSAFTARCVASAAGSPYDAVAAALAAIKGARHGGMSERVEALLAEVGERSQARRVLADRLRRGEAVPGFGHPLYPPGDPRAARLLELAGQAVSGSAAGRTRLDVVRAVVAAGRELLAEEPVLDYGLVALRLALDLPAGAPLALFAVGRTAGWIGQVIEEYGRGELIRPRARYVGPPPTEVASGLAPDGR